MSPSPRTASTRGRVAVGVLVLGISLVGTAWAQVRPGQGNIKKPKPSTTGGPIVRIRPVQPPPDPRIPGARAWQSAEIDSVSQAVKLGRALMPARTDLVRDPVEPPRPAPPDPEFTFRQRVTLRFQREDGVAYDARQVRVAGPGYEVKPSAAEVFLEGPATRTASPEIGLGLPDDWAFGTPTDSRLTLRDRRGDEIRENLTPIPPVRPVENPRLSALFATPQDRARFRAGLNRPPAPRLPKIEKSGFPSPATATLAVLSGLREIRTALDALIPVAPDAAPEARRQTWTSLELLAGRLQTWGPILKGVQRLTGGESKSEPRQVLKSDYKVSYAPLRATQTSASVRLAQYLGEALFWQAYCEAPLMPDRTAAIASLQDAMKSGVVSPALSAQLERYTRIAATEAAIQARERAGEYSPRPTPRILVTHNLTRQVMVRRTVVDYRLGSADLRAGDVVKSGALTIPFRLEGDAWRARLPRDAVKKGARIAIARRTAESELEAEGVIEGTDPYVPGGNPITRGPMRLTLFKSFKITAGGTESINVLEELDPVDWETAKMREQRRAAVRAAREGEDGSWWLPAPQAGITLRLRPSPFPEGARGKPAGKSFGQRVSDAFRNLGGRPENRSLLGRVIVDNLRLESPQAGHVAGVRVGSADVEVEDALGGKVPRNGLVRYLNGAVEMSLTNGKVDRIDIRRDLTQYAGKPAPTEQPGTISDIRHESNRLRAPISTAFQPQPGMELEVTVAGRPLAGKGSDYYRALVLERTQSDVVLKLVRKSKSGKTLDDAAWDVVRSLPPADTGAVILRSPAR